MKTKKILFFLLIFAAVLFFGKISNTYATAFDDCIAMGGSCEDCKDRDGAPASCGGGPPAGTDYDTTKFEKIGGVLVPKTGTIGLSDKEPGVILVAVLKSILYILGFLAILAFIISGLQYLLSGGDEKMVETAKRNLKWSIVGLVVAVSSLIILLTIDSLLKGINPG